MAAACKPTPRNQIFPFVDISDVLVDRAKQLLDLVDIPDSWEAGPCEGSGLVHFDAGPATAGADCGFVRVKPGVRFPWHEHQGLETSLVQESASIEEH